VDPVGAIAALPDPHDAARDVVAGNDALRGQLRVEDAIAGRGGRVRPGGEVGPLAGRQHAEQGGDGRRTGHRSDRDPARGAAASARAGRDDPVEHLARRRAVRVGQPRGGIRVSEQGDRVGHDAS
jgi:hypothetical protein